MNNSSAPSDTTGSERHIPSNPTRDKVFQAWLEAQDEPPEDNVFEYWINWDEIEAYVSRLQRQLANAVEHGNRKAARHYKWLIRNSHHANMLAIRQVAQENNG